MFFPRNLACTILASAILLLGLTSAAQAEVSFSVSPIRVELAGKPGGSHTDAIEVNNEGSEKVRIRITMQDWYLTEDGTPVFQKAGSQTRSCAAWLHINPVDFLLQPGEKKIVRYSVTIPEGVKDGGYWGAFIFETMPQIEPGQKTRSVAIKGNIASIIYVNAGAVVPAGEITDMGYLPGKENGTVTTSIRNDGNGPFRIKGKLKIVDAAGKDAAELDFADLPILAGAVRKVAVELKEKLPAGNYVAIATIDIGAKALLAGELPFTVK